MFKRKIGIIGAGAVGITFAYTAELSGICRELVILDVNQERLSGEVMDLNHGLSFVPRMNIVAGDYDSLQDADIVVLAAGVAQKQGESRLNLARRNVAITRDILGKLKTSGFKGILLVVANPVDILTRLCVAESGLPKGHVIGSGTVLDTARFRYFLSELINVDPHNIHAYIVGEHGDSEVALWSSAVVSGMGIDDYCRQLGIPFDESVKKSITDRVRDSAYHIIESKGVTNYAISLAMLRIIKAVLGDERRILTVSSSMDGHYGIDKVSIGIPALVGANGVESIIELPISAKEREQLQNSADQLDKTYQDVIVEK